MKLLLTQSQMLREWQLRSFPQLEPADYTLERSGGADASSVMKAKMEDWYRNLLHTARADLLNPMEIATECHVRSESPESGVITLPEGTLRVIDIVMDGWTGTPVIVHDPLSKTALLQKSRYTRGTARSPVAVVSGLTVGIFPASGKLVSLKAIVDLPDIYAVDSAAFATIPSILTST